MSPPPRDNHPSRPVDKASTLNSNRDTDFSTGVRIFKNLHMKKPSTIDDYPEAAELLKTIAHPERIHLLAALRDGPQCVCHLTALLGQRQPYVSQQLAYLREAGLVADYREGLNVYYRIREPRVFALLDTVGDIIGQPNAFRNVHISPRLLADCPCPRCTAA